MSYHPQQDPSIYETIVQYFQDKEIRFAMDEELPIIKSTFRGKNGDYQLSAQAYNEDKRASFHSYLGTIVPEARIQAVAEFLVRVNQGVLIGNFDMDFDKGTVKYKTSVDVDGGELTQEMVHTLVMLNLSMLDKYVPGLMRVMFGDTSPIDAIAQVEGLKGVTLTKEEVAMN